MSYKATEQTYKSFDHVFDFWGKKGFELKGAESGRWTDRDPLPTLGPDIRAESPTAQSRRAADGGRPCTGRASPPSFASARHHPDDWRQVPMVDESLRGRVPTALDPLPGTNPAGSSNQRQRGRDGAALTMN